MGACLHWWAQNVDAARDRLRSWRISFCARSHPGVRRCAMWVKRASWGQRPAPEHESGTGGNLVARGGTDAHGNLQIGMTLDGRARILLSHRVAFALMAGRWPERDINHRNGVRNDNRWSNLREATHAQGRTLRRRRHSRKRPSNQRSRYGRGGGQKRVASVEHARARPIDAHEKIPAGRDVDASVGTAVIPEPATWAMLLIGFASLGFTGNRSRAGAFRSPSRPIHLKHGV